MSDDVVERIHAATAWGAIGFGAVATAAPNLFAAAYGLPREDNLRTMIRLWGAATGALGTLLVGTQDPGTARRMMTVATAMNTVNTAAIALSGRGVRPRARLGGAVTSAAFAAAGAYALAQD